MASSTLLHRPKDARGSGKGSRMKMVTAIIRPERLDAVREALNKLNLVGGVTVTDVRGHGDEAGTPQRYMGTPYLMRSQSQVKIEIVIENHDVPDVLSLIRTTAHTGDAGDGKIFIADVVSAMRVRTGERGVDAL